LWLPLIEFLLNGWQFQEILEGFHEKSRINPKRKNKIGKKKVDYKNPCRE
jgi:hypothetical protein